MATVSARSYQYTPGAQLLMYYGVTQASIAETLGVSAVSVHRCVKGGGSLGLRLAVLDVIEREGGKALRKRLEEVML